jgi:rSAM/selenodomain-associated transferase 1
MISIIIPVRNQATGLKRTLASLVPEKNGHEVIVLDRGSVDGSATLARSTEWIRFVKTTGNQGAILNAGVAMAKGEILVFLGPGVTLERGWSASVEEAVQRPGFRIGCMRLAVNSKNPLYRLVEFSSFCRTAVFKRARIGQALFIRKADLEDQTPFSEGAALLGLDLCRRFAAEGGLVQVRRSAIHSPRHWERNGICAQIVADTTAWWGWRRTGEVPDSVAKRGEGRNAVLMFLRRPQPGKVKTWLGDIIGDERSARVYMRTVNEVLTEVDKARIEAETFIFYRPHSAQEEVSRWIGNGALYVPQKGSNALDKRKHAMEVVFGMAYENAVFLGPHCPSITREHLGEAISALKTNDLVVGPTDDGGCYLVGMRKPLHKLFDQIDWENRSMGADILRIGSEQGIQCTQLETLRNFDSAEDVAYNYAMGYMQD